jgi:hypothetical protein
LRATSPHAPGREDGGVTVRIAMWSGPRNISTAMMRSFESRADTVVSDEPFYGAYLKATGADHPMASEVIASMDCDWHSVAAAMSRAAPGDAPVWYQKHMVHHMVGPVAPDHLEGVTHAFLIRDPALMIASYAAKRETVAPEDLGLEAEADFFQREAERLGRAPPVVDSGDVLADPETALRALCAALALPWDPSMLAWQRGRRPTDGVWAPHWYGRVEASTGFELPPSTSPSLDDEGKRVRDAVQPHYERLARHRLRAEGA